MTTRTAVISGHNGDDIEAYLAEPTEAASPRGGVVVIHHMPGYDRATKEIARRIAELGYNVVMPNLYWREAPGAEPDDAAAMARAAGRRARRTAHRRCRAARRLSCAVSTAPTARSA